MIVAAGPIPQAQAIADELDTAGFAPLAQALRDAIDYASTGSEILTGLRFHLHAVGKHLDVPAPLRTRADTLAAAIDQTLRR